MIRWFIAFFVMNPKILEDLFNKDLLDYVVLNIKSELTKLDYSRTSGVSVLLEMQTRLRQSIQMTIHSSVEHEFRTTVCPELVSLENIRSIVFEIDGTQRYFLRQYLDNEKPSKTGVDFAAYSEVEIRNQVESMSKNLPVLFTNKKIRSRIFKGMDFLYSIENKILPIAINSSHKKRGGNDHLF